MELFSYTGLKAVWIQKTIQQWFSTYWMPQRTYTRIKIPRQKHLIIVLVSVIQSIEWPRKRKWQNMSSWPAKEQHLLIMIWKGIVIGWFHYILKRKMYIFVWHWLSVNLSKISRHTCTDFKIHQLRTTRLRCLTLLPCNVKAMTGISLRQCRLAIWTTHRINNINFVIIKRANEED